MKNFKGFSEWMQLREDNTRTGCKVGLYPPAYTLSQYTPAYYAPTAADYVTYHDIEKKKPTPTNPPSELSYTVVSQGSDGKISRWKEMP
jgi:hypothetical protein